MRGRNTKYFRKIISKINCWGRERFFMSISPLFSQLYSLIKLGYEIPSEEKGPKSVDESREQSSLAKKVVTELQPINLSKPILVFHINSATSLYLKSRKDPLGMFTAFYLGESEKGSPVQPFQFETANEFPSERTNTGFVHGTLLNQWIFNYGILILANKIKRCTPLGSLGFTIRLQKDDKFLLSEVFQCLYIIRRCEKNSSQDGWVTQLIKVPYKSIRVKLRRF